MRRLESLITQARADSDNSDFADDRGIQDNQFVQWANDAQDKLESLLVGLHCPLLQAEKESDAVARQREYDLPDDMYQNTSYECIEFSTDGQSDNYYPLDQKTKRERGAGAYGDPSIYAIRGRKFQPAPMPSSSGGSFRVTYYKALPKIDIRRGRVSAVTLDSSARTITTLTLDTTDTWDEAHIDRIEELGYISVVDRDGEQQMRRIPVSSINRTTGVVTLVAGFVYDSGETITVGDYVVSGRDADSHSQLPDNCERYLIVYMAWKGQKKDSSQDAMETLKAELKDIEDALTSTFAEPEQDFDGIPILDPELMELE